MEKLHDPRAHDRTKLLTVLQRQPLKQETAKQSERKELKDEKNPEVPHKLVLKSLFMLNPTQKETKSILRKIEEAEDVSITEDGRVRVGNRTLIDATIYLYNTQQSKKQLPDPD